LKKQHRDRNPNKSMIQGSHLPFQKWFEQDLFGGRSILWILGPLTAHSMVFRTPKALHTSEHRGQKQRYRYHGCAIKHFSPVFERTTASFSESI
jgi:hypothetical protein